jgi:hypothetical protein
MTAAPSFTPRPGPARDLAYSGVFGAAAFLLPTLFHLVHLGHVFMPMYLPLVTLAFLVRPGYAAGTAFLVPLLSALLTGMPPFFPPIALFMAVELGLMALVIALARQRLPRVPNLAILLPALMLGRVLYVALAYGFARVMTLPARFVAGLSLIAGWPGLLLMLAVVPVLVAVIRRRPHGA